MHISGWIRTSLIDFPDHIATVFFTPGCNFRCPMCQNADLVLSPDAVPRISEEAVWDFLARRRGKLTGVVVSGGEPTLQRDLLPFLQRVRAYGYAVKLDTNGYRPRVLASLLAEGVVDYVAMDIKAPPAKYARLAGLASVDSSRIERSVAILRRGSVAHEFRTTVVPGLLDAEDIEAIARWLVTLDDELPPPDLYVLQQFRGLRTLDPALAKVSPYTVDTLQEMADRARRWLPNVKIRGI